MKNLFFLVFCLFCASSFSQIENIRIYDNFMIDKVYAGGLSSTNFNLDSLPDEEVGFRIGAMCTYKPVNWLSVNSWFMYQAPTEGKAVTTRFWATIAQASKLNLSVGLMSAIPTELKPHKLSGKGQFETWTESKIPGHGLGLKINYKILDNLELGGGVVFRETSPEYSVKVAYKQFQISGWYNTIDSTSGFALVGKIDRVFSTFVYKQDDLIADILVVKINKKENISVYSDVGYSFPEKKLVRGEWGVLKGYESKFIKGLIGLGYEPDKKRLKGYLFIHL